MHLKNLILYFLILVSCVNYSQDKDDLVIGSSNYFEFHSDYWINLHHFLYQKASGSQLEKLTQDGNQFLEIGEDEVYRNLAIEQKQALDEAIKYYKEYIVSRSLLFELGNERIWLQDQNESQYITDTTFSKKYTSVLNKASEAYRNTFWPVHRKQNSKILKKHLSLIKKLEQKVIPKMEQFAIKKWPSEQQKVRVDITSYANYAGAYTPTRPKFNVFVSSLDPNSEKIAFIETIFHEGSHLLFNRNGAFRSTILELFDKKNFSVKYPRNLWHVSLFYLCGRTLQDELKKMNYPDYKMILDDRNIFSKYNKKGFRKILEDYYQNKSDHKTTINKLLDDIE